MSWILVCGYACMCLLHALALRNDTIRELIIKDLCCWHSSEESQRTKLIALCWLWVFWWVGIACRIIYFCTIGLIFRIGTALIGWVADI